MAATVTEPSLAEAATAHAYEPMPNFVGLGQSAVHAAMYRAQLYYKTQGPGADSPRWVRVVGEIPAAGTPVPTLSTVILEVTTVPAPARHVVAAVKKPVATSAVAKRTVARKAVVRVVSITRTGTKKYAPTRKKTTTHAVVDVKVGVATWYSYVPGQCATWYLPYGTRITVQDLRNGRVITCVVTDREGARGDRAVDLSETQFAELAPLAVGVVPVRVTW